MVALIRRLVASARDFLDITDRYFAPDLPSSSRYGAEEDLGCTTHDLNEAVEMHVECLYTILAGAGKTLEQEANRPFDFDWWFRTIKQLEKSITGRSKDTLHVSHPTHFSIVMHY